MTVCRTPEQPGGAAAAAPLLVTTLTCPRCGRQSEETMPTDHCVVVHDCPGCGATLRPKPGDCCVYCSWASVPCPPIQAGGCEPPPSEAGGGCCA